jgi:excisionase family DNA binding protein
MSTNLEVPVPVTSLMSAAQVAERLGCSQQSVYRWADIGLLPRKRIGKRIVRFERDDVERFIERGLPEQGAKVVPMKRGSRG